MKTLFLPPEMELFSSYSVRQCKRRAKLYTVIKILMVMKDPILTDHNCLFWILDLEFKTVKYQQ